MEKVIHFLNTLPKGQKYLLINGAIFAGIFLLNGIPLVTTALCIAGAVVNLYAAFVDTDERS